MSFGKRSFREVYAETQAARDAMSEEARAAEDKKNKSAFVSATVYFPLICPKLLSIKGSIVRTEFFALIIAALPHPAASSVS